MQIFLPGVRTIDPPGGNARFNFITIFIYFIGGGGDVEREDFRNWADAMTIILPQFLLTMVGEL